MSCKGAVTASQQATQIYWKADFSGASKESGIVTLTQLSLAGNKFQPVGQKALVIEYANGTSLSVKEWGQLCSEVLRLMNDTLGVRAKEFCTSDGTLIITRKQVQWTILNSTKKHELENNRRKNSLGGTPISAIQTRVLNIFNMLAEASAGTKITVTVKPAVFLLEVITA